MLCRSMKSGQTRKSRVRGFSLIELLIVVSIVGILVAFALPSYTQYMVRAGRTEASATLLAVMERQEQYYRNNLSYTTTLTDLGYGAANVESESGLYRVTAGTCDGGLTIRRCVSLTATALERQVSDGNITLNSRGEKTGNWPGQ